MFLWNIHNFLIIFQYSFDLKKFYYTIVIAVIVIIDIIKSSLDSKATSQPALGINIISIGNLSKFSFVKCWNYLDCNKHYLATTLHFWFTSLYSITAIHSTSLHSFQFIVGSDFIGIAFCGIDGEFENF